MKPLPILLLLSGLVGATAGRVAAQSSEQGKAIFERKCTACHTIGGGDLVGPDLKGVLAKWDAAWLEQFIREPDEMVRKGDPIANQLLKEYNSLPMPNMGLSRTDVSGILLYLESQGGSDAKEAQSLSAGPLPTGDPAAGQNLFTGATPLQNGGTSCMACHSVAGVGALGGGNMGPDLTHIFRRYGEAGLATALSSLPFPTMKPLYVGKQLTKTEQSDLRAFFARADQQTAQISAPATGWIWGIGVMGAALLFGVMVVFRPRQHESLSETLRRKA